MNRDYKKDSKRLSNPYDGANFISKYTYWWLKNLFKIGMSQEIHEDDLYACSRKHTSEKAAKKFEMLWWKEMSTDKPSLIKVTLKVFWYRVMIVGFFFAIFEMACKLSNPLLLGLLIGFFMDNPNNFTNSDAYLIATGIALTLILPLLFHHPFMLFLFTEAMKLRIACCSLIYSKILSFTKHTMRDGVAGQAINLMSNDVSRFDWLFSFTHDVWRSPIGAAVAAYFIYTQVGWSGLVGMAILLMFMPVQAWLGKKAANFRLETAEVTDKRVESMYSIINGIQVIKMYCWENAYEKMIKSIRQREIAAIAKAFYIKATLMSSEFLTSAAVFTTFVTYVYSGNSITAQKAFVTIAYFNYLNTTLVHFWPMAVTSVAEGWISLKRVEEFLLQETPKASENKFPASSSSALNPGFTLKGATAYWDQEKQNVGIKSVDLEVGKINLVGIVGQVGCGKTTLLEVILQELPLSSGSLEVKGTVSYASQQAWIFGGSVKNNIVFTEAFDEKRYKKVVHVCALERDMELFPHGDGTIVGDRGVSLSGGQKARINLARAIYKKADIYLLDDPLSAVDTNVGKHIFEKCIEDFLKDKICVLVTHQLQYLKNVKQIVVMSAGKIKSSSLDMTSDGSRTYQSREILEDIEELDKELHRINQRKHSEAESTPVDDKKEQNVVKEGQQEGEVTQDVYLTYLKAVKSSIFVFFVVLLFITSQVLYSGIYFFVSVWVNWEEQYSHLETVVDESLTFWDGEWWTTDRHIYFYAILISLLLIFMVSRSFAFYRMCLRISTNLHDLLFRGVTRATMVFFHQNSNGRILNRFSKDIGLVDSQLPVILADCAEFFLELAGIVTIVAIINYWLLLPTFIMSVMFWGLRKVFLTTARNVKRVEAITRSPIFTHTTASIEGLSTIRAFNAQHRLRLEFDEHQNINTSAWFLFVATSRGFAFWLDLFCVFYVTCVIYSFLLLGKDVIGANVGLAITQAINLIGICNWGLRQTAELENQMTSVERVVEYGNLPSERSLETDKTVAEKLSPQWPEHPKIKFKNVSLKYSQSGDYVLKDLNFDVQENEKIGIVGRTGAGKSSIIQALFNLSIVDGSIEIDSVDINTLGLHTFRTKISIIPQDPTLFVGTLRSNLDPFNEKTDDDLWRSLEQVQLKSAVESLAGGLETKVADGGFNFSVGQRQLFCLARAILKNNKILILDEATANVDTETDELIQSAIRTQFRNCTVLTVAHRLNTILDNERVMVIDAGCITEFDSPQKLYESGGSFYKMINEAGLKIDNVKREKSE